MASFTTTESRAIQQLSDGHISFVLPGEDAVYTQLAAQMCAVGVFPFNDIPGADPGGTVPAAQNTIWRAIQFLSDGHISLRLPHPDGAFDERTEMAVVAGTYPFVYTVAAPAAAILHRPLIARAGDPVGTYSTLILGVNREKLH